MSSDAPPRVRSRRWIWVWLVAVIVAAVTLSFVLLYSSGKFADARDLMEAIDAGGVECREVTIFDTADQGVLSGRCYVSGGYEVDAYVFDNERARDQWYENLRAAGWEHDVLIGENWLLTTGHTPTTRAIRDVIGGRIEPAVSSTSS